MESQNKIPTLKWDEFYHNVFDWRQGEHVSIIGPTGQGKTTLALALLPKRRFVLIFSTKPKDKQTEELGWKIFKKWPIPVTVERAILWPKFDGPEDFKNQQQTFAEAMLDIFKAGNWCVYVDETFYFSNILKLDSLLEMYWLQARSLGISFVAGTQRPSHVPLLMYDQATWLFFFRDNDERNLRRLGSMGGLETRTIMQTVATLDTHQFLAINTRTGEMFRSTVEGVA